MLPGLPDPVQPFVAQPYPANPDVVNPRFVRMIRSNEIGCEYVVQRLTQHFGVWISFQ